MSLRSSLVISMIAVLSIACGESEEVADPISSVIRTEPPVDFETAATLSEGFQTPESVLYDAEQDVYFVSNINGSPLETDGNGYISRIDGDDREVRSKWIDGTAEGVALDAPKGMAIIGDELWVTDITRIRRFDRRSGVPAGAIEIPGATFMNDLAAGPDDTAYASDSGMKLGASGFESTGTDAIYRISPEGEVSQVVASTDLNGPNGILVDGSNVWAVSFSSNELYRVDGGSKADTVTLPSGGLDGIAATRDGRIFVSSWEGETIYERTGDGEFVPLIENLQSPADIGFDSRRDLLLIPLFELNQVEIRPVSNGSSGAATATTTDTPSSTQ
ncbi:MAG: SMP-30/gluconolactonase/LRE family protein [Acidobacteria bacterium]|nr:SMP-30/gluconolactonase/LRE family protein [Acidobacteriota bacterium]